MIQVINKSRRRLGLPGRHALILDPGQAVPVTEEQVNEIRANKMAAQWLERGVIELNGTPTPSEVAEVKIAVADQQKETQHGLTLPEGIAGTGVELQTIGGGWYKVFVNGFEVSDGSVRKAEAESIMAEYQ